MPTASRVRLPGNWLLVIARLVFDDTVRTTVVNQTLADLQTEWLAAGTNRVSRFRARWRGYVAFWTIVAISPVAFSRGPAEDAGLQMQRSTEMTALAPIRLLLILTVLGLGAGYLYGRAQPPLYRSVAVIQVVPPRVPESILKMSTSVSLPDRLRATEATILSRTRLEHLVKEFNLYQEMQKTEPMEDIVARMRRDISTGVLKADVVQVQYSGKDPVTVMKVTERLASLFLEESLKDGTRRAEGSSSFIEAETEEAARRVVEVNAELERAGRGASAMPKRLELEVIQNRYKNLVTQREEAKTMVNIQRRQIGEQFVLLDPAQVSRQPIGPPPLVYALGGGAAGIGVAGLILLVSFTRRYINRRGDMAGATA